MSQHPGMHGKVRKRLREMCDGPEEGATVATLAGMLHHSIEATRAALKAMPDTYIDRYVYINGRRPSSVWMIVTPPPDCPPPPKKNPMH
jgi:hypothetical protein